MKWEKSNGFTQMQTLFIMGIIALIVFAAVAVPFYNNCKQKQAVSKLKLIYTSLVQANRMYALVNHSDTNEYEMEDMSVEEFAETYFTPYLQVHSSCKKDQSACWNSPQYTDLVNRKIYNKSEYSLVLKGKAVLGFHKDKNGLITLIADIDGKSGENKLGRDVFVFSFFNSGSYPKLCDEAVYTDRFVKDGIHFGGYDECGIPHDTYSYSELSGTGLKDGCNKKASASENGLGVGSACLALITESNWSIDKIYPW